MSRASLQNLAAAKLLPFARIFLFNRHPMRFRLFLFSHSSPPEAMKYDAISAARTEKGNGAPKGHRKRLTCCFLTWYCRKRDTQGVETEQRERESGQRRVFFSSLFFLLRLCSSCPPLVKFQDRGFHSLICFKIAMDEQWIYIESVKREKEAAETDDGKGQQEREKERKEKKQRGPERESGEEKKPPKIFIPRRLPTKRRLSPAAASSLPAAPPPWQTQRREAAAEARKSGAEAAAAAATRAAAARRFAPPPLRALRLRRSSLPARSFAPCVPPNHCFARTSSLYILARHKLTCIPARQ
jgi:hypothetical protein